MATDLAPWADSVDVAFSYEVIYLLPNLAGHARQIRSAPRAGGVYDAVDGCHTASPLWPRWRTVIGASSSARVQDRSPDGYVEAFHGEGFEVSVWRFGFQGFVAPPRSRDYCPSVVDALSYPDEHKLLFRLERRR